LTLRDLCSHVAVDTGWVAAPVKLDVEGEADVVVEKREGTCEDGDTMVLVAESSISYDESK
jgi:hypothetical protein